MNVDEKTQSVLKALVAAQEQGEPAVLATIVRENGSVPRHAGSKMLVYSDGRFIGSVGGGEMESLMIEEALAALADGQPRMVPYQLAEPSQSGPDVYGGEVEIFLEPYQSPATVFVVGCGHVGRAVAYLAGWLGFHVVVTDDRPDLVTPEVVPGASLYLAGSIESALDQFKVTAQTYTIIVTRNAEVDRHLLPHLLATPTPYIGIIGSKRRWHETKRLLTEDGITADQLARFHSPVGLELNAETPKEIAVSILAEVIMLQRGGTGERMAI
ncbi:MAG: XdhC family protein [Candidatus Promineifilaceae bacterium]